MPPEDVSLVGRTIAGKFEILERIGGGAMGAVYRARQTALDAIVAIKVMHRELTRDPMFSARFLQEAKAASRIDHPNSLRVLDFGEEPDGILYMAMEYLDGRDLYAELKEVWPIDDRRIIDILSQTLAALAVAHEGGVIHRDLKPENIMILRRPNDEGVTADFVKVCDFGIAKLIEERGSERGPKLTSQGVVVGTPEYMSPEQGRGEPLDARSDIYGVGCLLYQMLTRRVPFEAETALGVVFKHVSEEPPLPSALRPGVDLRLESICKKALSKDPATRYQSARGMRRALQAVLTEGTVDDIEKLPESELPEEPIESAPTLIAIESSPSPPGSLPHPKWEESERIEPTRGTGGSEQPSNETSSEPPGDGISSMPTRVEGVRTDDEELRDETSAGEAPRGDVDAGDEALDDDDPTNPLPSTRPGSRSSAPPERVSMTSHPPSPPAPRKSGFLIAAPLLIVAVGSVAMFVFRPPESPDPPVTLTTDAALGPPNVRPEWVAHPDDDRAGHASSRSNRSRPASVTTTSEAALDASALETDGGQLSIDGGGPFGAEAHLGPGDAGLQALPAASAGPTDPAGPGPAPANRLGSDAGN